jgi:hypothetical protein
MRAVLLPWLVVAAVLTSARNSDAQEGRIRQLEQRVSRLEKGRDLDDQALGGFGAYLISGLGILAVGAFCALWARSTRRDPWLWLAAGVVFNFLALIAVWIKHEEDKKAASAEGAAPGSAASGS